MWHIPSAMLNYFAPMRSLLLTISSSRAVIVESLCSSSLRRQLESFYTSVPQNTGPIKTNLGIVERLNIGAGRSGRRTASNESAAPTGQLRRWIFRTRRAVVGTVNVFPILVLVAQSISAVEPSRPGCLAKKYTTCGTVVSLTEKQ
jgi:hypothetical protein